MIYKYQYLNEINQLCLPNSTKLKDNKSFEFYSKYFLQKAISVLKFNLPDTWERDYFLYTLFCNGYICIFDTTEYGIIPQHCTLGGINIFYEPKTAIVANPVLKKKYNKLIINNNCAIIKLQPDFSGVMDLVGVFAERMSIAAESLEMNTFNAKLSYIFPAKDLKQAKSYKEMYDRVARGEPAVVVGDFMFDATGKPKWQNFAQNLSTNFIANDILSLMKKIEADFDTYVGIPNANTDKRERLISDEVNANNVDVQCRAALWLETVQDGIKKAVEMYPDLKGNFSCDWRIAPNVEYINGGD